MAISRKTSAAELAARVSQALEAAGIRAVLSGGGAVSIHTTNEYESSDLDFVTQARKAELSGALEGLGFTPAKDGRHFEHPDTELFLEFPAGPLQFGDRTASFDEVPTIVTEWGPLRVVTPTQCVMDRLAAFWHWNDRQSWDQALMVAKRQRVDYDELRTFAREERRDPAEIDRLRALAAAGR